MRYGGKDGKTLEQLTLKKAGKWWTSQRFLEIKTAKAWGLTPDEWDECTDANKAQMMAYEEESAKMAAYEDQQHEAELEKSRNKPRAKK